MPPTRSCMSRGPTTLRCFVSALSIEFESDLRNIYSRSRTVDEVTREIAALRDKISERRDAYEKEYERTSQIIESRFDDKVRRVFKRLREDLPTGLADLDRDLANLVDGFLTAQAIPFRRFDEDGARDLRDSRCALPRNWAGKRSQPVMRRRLKDAEALNLLHPLVQAAITEAQGVAGGRSHQVAAAAHRFPWLPRSPGKKGFFAQCWSTTRLRASAELGGGGSRRRYPIDPVAGNRDPPLASDRSTGIQHRARTHNRSMMPWTKRCLSTSAAWNRARTNTSSALPASWSAMLRIKFSSPAAS